MTSTANAHIDFADTDNSHQSRRIDLLSAWLFGKVNTDCVLANISRSGAAVLIPIQENNPAETLELIIMSPENQQEILTKIRAQLRWIDIKYSKKYKKAGLEFQNIDALHHHTVDSIMQHFSRQKRTDIKCNLFNC